MPRTPFDATFEGDGAEFHVLNAVWLARLSKVVYERREADARTKSSPWGVTLKKWDWLDQGPTHVALWTAPGHILTVFRGTDERADWTDNLSIGRQPHDWGKVHSGFARALARVEGELLSTLAGMLGERSWKIWLTGHSLGGALATIMAAKLRLANLPVEGVYTYGQPHVGDGTFVRRYNEELKTRTYRVVNHMDAVAYGLRTRYKHVGTLVQLHKKSGLRIGGPNRPDRMPGTRRRRAGVKGGPRVSRNNALSLPDHNIRRYIRKLEAIAIAEGHAPWA